MTNRNGQVWEERQTRDWFWVEKKATGYFSSEMITCEDAVQITRGRRRPPLACFEVRDIGCFEPVSSGVIKVLARVLDYSKKARNAMSSEDWTV
jgi:hypothetical protein